MTADEHAAPEAGASAPFSVDIRLWDADSSPQGGAVALVRAEVAYSGESTVFGADGTVSDTEDSLAPGASSWLGLASHQRIGTGEGGLADAFALRVDARRRSSMAPRATTTTTTTSTTTRSRRFASRDATRRAAGSDATGGDGW